MQADLEFCILVAWFLQLFGEALVSSCLKGESKTVPVVIAVEVTQGTLSAGPILRRLPNRRRLSLS